MEEIRSKKISNLEGLASPVADLAGSRRRTYVVLARAMSEAVVVDDLRERGFLVYTPSCRRWVRSATGRRIKVEKPLLAGYVFLWTDDIDRDFDAVRHSRRVTGILGLNGEPFPLPSREQASLVWMLLSEAFGGFDYTGEVKPKCTIGQRVRILVGMFKGQVGTLVKLTSKVARVEVDSLYVRGNITVARADLDEAVAAA